MNSVSQTIAENLKRVEERIASACARAGRDPNSVQLIAVTKYAELDWVRELIAQGITHLGESRPQQLVERAELLGTGVEWHLIGHLQRNKIRKLVHDVGWVHSIDSLKLLDAIDRVCSEEGVRCRLLLEVNLSGESSKDGWNVDALRQSLNALLACKHVDVCGLMTMAPLTDDGEQVRQVFTGLQQLAVELNTESQGQLALQELSMGMSGDFELAIEEGATMIRVGSALFEGLAAE